MISFQQIHQCVSSSDLSEVKRFAVQPWLRADVVADKLSVRLLMLDSLPDDVGADLRELGSLVNDAGLRIADVSLIALCFQDKMQGGPRSQGGSPVDAEPLR